jgi:hypothetical protein
MSNWDVLWRLRPPNGPVTECRMYERGPGAFEICLVRVTDGVPITSQTRKTRAGAKALASIIRCDLQDLGWMHNPENE